MNHQLQVGSFVHLISDGDVGQPASRIKCAVQGDVVRTLTPVDPHHVHIKCGDDTELTVDMNTPISYEPWFMDRGSMLFVHEGKTLKICTEFDIIEFHDGKQFSIVPDKIRRNPPKAQ